MISNAQKEIGKEIEDLRDSLRASHNLIEKYRKEVEQLEAAAENGENVGASTAPAPDPSPASAQESAS